ILKNKEMLPAVKVTNKYYNQKQLKTPLDEEHAMINGVITDSHSSDYSQIKNAPNLLNQTNITKRNVKYKNNILTFPKNGDGLTITLPKEIAKKYKDMYLMLHLERKPPQSNFSIQFNDYSNNRLFEDSKYRMLQDDLLYRVPVNSDCKRYIALSNGTYNLKLQGFYREDYKTLKSVNKKNNYSYKEENGAIDIDLNNHSGGMAVINIPYRNGMTATVDNKEVQVEKVNHIMTGVNVSKNSKHIKIQYKPPFFKTMIFVSIISIILSYLYTRKVNKS